MDEFNWDTQQNDDGELEGVDPDAQSVPEEDSFNWDAQETLESGEGDASTKGLQVQDTPVGYLESLARGTADTYFSGADDEIFGGVKSVFTGKPYKEERDKLRLMKHLAQKTNPKAYTGGSVIGAVGQAFTPGLNVAGKASPLVRGAFMGGAYGLGSSDADITTQAGREQAAWDTGKGAAAGAVLDKSLSTVGKIPGAMKNSANWLSARALGAERGTIKKLGADKVSSAGRYGLDEKIVGPMSSTEGMMSRNAYVQSRAGKGMEGVYKSIDEKGASTFNPLDTALKFDLKSGDFWKSPINAGETKQFDRTLDSILMRGHKNIPLAEAQALKEEIGKTANWRNTLNVTDKERMAREAYGVISDSIDEATDQGAQAIGAKDLLETLQKSRALYSNSKTADELLQNKQAREQGNKMFGLTNNIAGAAGYVAGGPIAAAKVLGVKMAGEKFGPQTLAVGLDKISNALKFFPDKLGKYAPILMDAKTRGAAKLGLTHQLLMKTKPDYADIINKISEGEQQ